MWRQIAFPQEQGVFMYGDEVINYDIIRRTFEKNDAKPKPRKVIIKVHPDQRVVAIVPHDATPESI